MADQRRELTDLFEEVMTEMQQDGGLDPDNDLTWQHLDPDTPDFESDYHD